MNKANVLNFLLIAAASAVGVVLIAPWVSKLAAKSPVKLT